MTSVVLFINRETVRSQRSLEKIGAVLEAEPDVVGRLAYRMTAEAFALE